MGVGEGKSEDEYECDAMNRKLVSFGRARWLRYMYVYVYERK